MQNKVNYAINIVIPTDGILHGINYGKNPDGSRTVLASMHQLNILNRYAVQIRFAKTSEEKLDLMKEHHKLVKNEMVKGLLEMYISSKGKDTSCYNEGSLLYKMSGGSSGLETLSGVKINEDNVEAYRRRTNDQKPTIPQR